MIGLGKRALNPSDKNHYCLSRKQVGQDKKLFPLSQTLFYSCSYLLNCLPTILYRHLYSQRENILKRRKELKQKQFLKGNVIIIKWQMELKLLSDIKPNLSHFF